jgi:hypothetical protein
MANSAINDLEEFQIIIIGGTPVGREPVVVGGVEGALGGQTRASPSSSIWGRRRANSRIISGSWGRSTRILSLAAGAALVVMVGGWLMLTPQAFAASTFFTCKSVDVSSYPERIHVRCDKPASGVIVFFAIPTANSAHAARILSILTSAHIARRNIVVEYDPADMSGEAFGCVASNCRRLLSVGVE